MAQTDVPSDLSERQPGGGQREQLIIRGTGLPLSHQPVRHDSDAVPDGHAALREQVLGQKVRVRIPSSPPRKLWTTNETPREVSRGVSCRGLGRMTARHTSVAGWASAVVGRPATSGSYVQSASIGTSNPGNGAGLNTHPGPYVAVSS